MTANLYHRTVMDEKEAKRIRQQWAAKVPKRDIMEQHRISREKLYAIVRGPKWRHTPSKA